jgi:hypothetical protein
MTSIFNSYYSSNLHRLNSSGEKRSETAADKDNKFARVLSDFERHPAESKETQPLTAEKKDSSPAEKNLVPTFSNLHQAEMSLSPEIPLNTTPPQLSSIISAENPLYNTVSLNRSPVKISAPDNVAPSPLPVSTNIPPSPTIVFAGRIAESRPPTPTLPHSAEERPSAPAIAEVERTNADLPRRTAGYSKSDAIKEIITTAGKYYGVDPNLSLAVAQVESAYEPSAVSKDGHHSKGIFQLLDSTGRTMLDHVGLEERYDPFDPAQNAYLGVGYLRKLHDIFSEETDLGANIRTEPARSAEQLEKLAVAAFNAGEGSVARAQAKAKALGKNPGDFSAIEPHLPASTRLYVRKVTQLKQALARQTMLTHTV